MASPGRGVNLFSVFDTWTTRVCKGTSVFAAFCGALMMTIAVLEVINRTLFRFVIPMGVEFIEELNVYLVFLVIAYVALQRGHIRITVLERLFPTAVIYVLRIFGYLLGIAIFGIAAWQTWNFTVYAYGVPMEKFGPWDFDRWPFIAGLFFGWACLVVAFMVLIGRAIRAWSKGEPLSFF
jgi:TRAP-type C4-dicarboxylate transport system permease small subunit